MTSFLWVKGKKEKNMERTWWSYELWEKGQTEQTEQTNSQSR